MAKSQRVTDGLSQRAYAKRRGVARTAIQRAIESGRIKPLPNGKIDPVAADRALDATASTKRGSRKAESLDAPVTDHAAAVKKAEESYYEARARKERWQADQAELTYRKNAGELVEAASVRESAFQVARRARDLLAAVPDRIAAIVAGLDDAEECRRVIADEVQRVCDELSGEPPA